MNTLALTLCLTGSCRHPEHSTRRDKSWRAAEYPMFAAVMDRGGDRIVFDPGYAPRLIETTDAFPERLYRWATPMQIAPELSLASRLDALGLRASVSHIIVSHFHADHIAGLIDFPHARVLTSRAAWRDFSAHRGVWAVRKGYVRALVPENLESRIRFIEDFPAISVDASMAPFTQAHDVFGDRSLLLIALPGHSAGQFGAVFCESDGADRFLIADATWSLDGLSAGQPPPNSTLHFIGDRRAYIETWHRLRALHARRPDLRLIPSHCVKAAARERAALV